MYLPGKVYVGSKVLLAHLANLETNMSLMMKMFVCSKLPNVFSIVIPNEPMGCIASE